MLRTKVFGFLLGAGLLCAGGVAQAGEAWDFTTPGTSFSNGSWDFGASFLMNTNVTATGLGYYADPTTGNVASNPVALYQCSNANCVGGTGTLIASATVTNIYPEYGHFRFVTITPVNLIAGDWYQVDGVSNVQNYTWNDPGFFTDPAITYVAYSDTWVSTNTVQFLNYVRGDVSDGYWGANVFLGPPSFATPEPGTLALLGTALVGFGVLRRRSAR
jgi:hypothetical protein